VLDSIYGEELTKEDPNKFNIRVSVGLTLHVQYVSSYPAETPPLFCLVSITMDASTVKANSEKLIALFEETKGDAVVYNWVEWLRENV
jgi:hypothetical protein